MPSSLPIGVSPSTTCNATTRPSPTMTWAICLNPQHAVAFCNRGFAKNNLQRYDEAITDYDHAIRLNPGIAVAFNNRGLAKYNLQRSAEAIANYDDAIPLN